MSKRTGRKPSIKAAILCDQAIREAESNKWTLVGLWDRLTVPRQPSPENPIFHPKLGIYFYLADCTSGIYTVSMELLWYGETIEGFLKIDATVEIHQEMTAAEFALNLPPIPLVKLGTYSFRLTMNDEYIGEKKFEVVLPGGS